MTLRILTATPDGGIFYGPTLPVSAPRDVAVAPMIGDPSSAQFQLWLAQAQRDRGLISDREMAVVERVAGPRAKRSITLFNPFTMQKRRVELP